MYISLHVKYPLFVSDFLTTVAFSRRISKNPLMWNLDNLSSGNRAVPCGRMDGHTNMTKLIVAFRYFANAPKKNGAYFSALFCYC